MRKTAEEGGLCRRSGVEKAVTEYLADRQRRHLAPGTIVRERYELRPFLAFCAARHIEDPVDITPEGIDEFHLYLNRERQGQAPGSRGLPRSPLSVTRRLRALKQFFEFLVSRDELLFNPMARLEIREVSPILVDRAVRPDEFERMLARVRSRGPLALRNRAMLEMLFGCGLRRAELLALDVYDVDLAAGVVDVRCGKGGKRRLVPIAGQAERALVRYVEAGRPLLVSQRSGAALFLNWMGRRLGGTGLGQIVMECARRAGLGRPVCPHSLRHGYATALLKGGADVRHIQELLGHARLDTTERYTVVDVADLRRVHRRTHPRERWR